MSNFVSNLEYKNKYPKYKIKYLNLLEQMGGSTSGLSTDRLIKINSTLNVQRCKNIY